MNFDITPYLHRSEGQHFDRKSLFRGRPGQKQARDRRTVRDQIAEYVAAFANSEGGVLVMGIEDDGTVTGHDYPSDAVQTMLNVPGDRLNPEQEPGFLQEVDGKQLLVFNIQASSVPVQVVGDGYPLRIGDQTIQASFEQIEGMKFQGLMESFEARVSRTNLQGLNHGLIQQAKEEAGLPDISHEDYLIQRRLGDWRGEQFIVRQAAELLFVEGLPQHPNAGIRIFRVVGTERKTGIEHNVEELDRIEGPVPVVLSKTFQTISGLLRKPSRLTPGGKFKQVSEYPEFSWKEAILNAVAHRDYSITGRGVEVWLFNDRMEVSSPGSLVAEITIDRLLSMERVHASRNPRMVRTLVDLGFMRDQGEGIPRMFAEMEALFLAKPLLESDNAEIRVTLRNSPNLSEGDRTFVESIGDVELSDNEFRALFEAYRHGRVDNSRLRQLAGLTYTTSSNVLRGLRDRELLELHSAGAASHYTLHPRLSDDGELEPDNRELEPDSVELTSHEQRLVESLGARPRKEKLRPVITALLHRKPWRPTELTRILGRKDVRALVDNHLKPMLDEGLLARTIPDNPTDPNQAYYATEKNLGPLFDKDDTE